MVSPEEADAKIRTFTLVAIVWFLGAMGAWFGLGYMYYAWSLQAAAQHDATTQELYIGFATTWFFFGILAIVFCGITGGAVYGALNAERYDAAYNRGILIGAVGIFFGLGAGIMLILSSKNYLKTHPKYLATLPVPTPICERCGQPVTFDKEEGGWYCPTCKIHLTKGAKKPKVDKPILPPVAPKPRPKPGYGPPKPGYGPPKPGYGPPKPGYGPPKPGYGPPKPMGVPPPKPMGPPGAPKPMGPPGVPPPKPMGPPGAPPPKPMGPPGGPQVRNVPCNNCGRTFQWNMADPSIRFAKCPWCNGQVPL